MSIFQRISDIISANLNELTEGFENPEQMLRQAIGEMEESIAHATRDTARALASEKTIAKELKNNQALVETWHQRAEKAVAAGDDDLARRALKRKQEHELPTLHRESQKMEPKDPRWIRTWCRCRQAVCRNPFSHQRPQLDWKRRQA